MRAAVTGGVEREADHLGQAIKVVPHPVREGAWDEAIVNQARHPRRRPLADGGAGRDGRVAQHVAQEAARTALARRERAALARREPLRGRKETASDEGFPGGIGHDAATVQFRLGVAKKEFKQKQLSHSQKRVNLLR